MKKIGHALLFSYLAFAGMDRINFASGIFDSFNLTPHIPLSILLIVFLIIFKFHKIDFSWISKNSFFLLSFSSFLFFIILSVFFSSDILLSSKRLILLLLIIFTIVTFLSSFDLKEINNCLYYASIHASLIFYIFNLILFFNWIGYIDITSNIINFYPDSIAYLVPRLGGFCQDVNRGTFILFLYTYILIINKKNTLPNKIIIILNIICILLSLSRTGIMLMFITLFIYLTLFKKSTNKIQIVSILFISLFGSIILINYYTNLGFLDIDLALEERFNIFDPTMHSSTYIHLNLFKDALDVIFNDIKVLLIGCGHGISYILLMGYQWSGSKYGNLHSQVLSILLENGIFATVSYLFISLLIPLRTIKNDIFPIILGLFCFNLFYQLNNEPLYWFIILYYYKYSYHKLRYAENKDF